MSDYYQASRVTKHVCMHLSEASAGRKLGSASLLYIRVRAHIPGIARGRGRRRSRRRGDLYARETIIAGKRQSSGERGRIALLRSRWRERYLESSLRGGILRHIAYVPGYSAGSGVIGEGAGTGSLVRVGNVARQCRARGTARYRASLIAGGPYNGIRRRLIGARRNGAAVCERPGGMERRV